MKKFLKGFFLLILIIWVIEKLSSFLITKKETKIHKKYHFPPWDPGWENSEGEFYTNRRY